jgi:uncharacterized protein
MKTDFNTILKDVIQLLNDSIPKYLTYHNTAHTLYVLEKAVHIAEKEKVSKTDLKLIKLAVLYHDIGFITSHIEHEKESCKIARKQLKDYGYSKEDIEIICGIIMATKIPQKPDNLLEQIVADADLEYLATKHFEPIGELLYKELKHFNSDLSKTQWLYIQIDFLSKHVYHTLYCRRYKSFRKLKNLKRLKMKSKSNK